MSKHKTKPEDAVPETEEIHEIGDADSSEEVTAEQIEKEFMEVTASDEMSELIEQLQQARDEAVAGRQRAHADFLNFQKRARENENRALLSGASEVVRVLLPVLDHFDLALGHDEDSMSVEQLLGGVRIVREELTRALESHGVSVIRPEIGDDFDPHHHQAVQRQPTSEHEPGTIVAVPQVGYMIEKLMLRPASVVVAAPLEDPEPGPAGQEVDEGETD